MNFFKKIDNYLLHRFPSIWITRIHFFLPIGLGLVLLVYFGNLAIGWNPKNSTPSAELWTLLIVIPVLIYLVYWFIFQSRYNVAKSGGKMSYLAEYINFFLYTIVFAVALMLIVAVPLSNRQKLKLAVSEEMLQSDIENLNTGNALVNSEGWIEILDNGNFYYTRSNFIDDYYYWSGGKSFMRNEIYEEVTEEITEREALQRIERYVESYNRYTWNPITKSPQELFADRLAEIEDEYRPYNDYYYERKWDIEWKIDEIRDAHLRKGLLGMGNDEHWFWKISIGFAAWLALLVWIFKQMNLRHFIFGFISLCITPLLAGLIAVIVFEIMYRFNSYGEYLVTNITLLTYLVVAFFFIRGYLQKTLNQTAYVLSMYLQFIIPLLPVAIYAWVYVRYRYEPFISGMTEDDRLNLIYWSSVILSLVSIALFKPVYARFRSMPSIK